MTSPQVTARSSVEIHDSCNDCSGCGCFRGRKIKPKDAKIQKSPPVNSGRKNLPSQPVLEQSVLNRANDAVKSALVQIDPLPPSHTSGYGHMPALAESSK